MARPSQEQWDTLLDLVASDKELLHGEFLAPGGAVRTQGKWQDISIVLNAVPGGTTKNGEQWKAAFISLRSRARRSCRELASYRRGTGGGIDMDINGLGLSDLYKRVISLTGMTAAVGTKCPDPLMIQLQRRNAAQRNGQEIEQAAPAQVIPNADVLLAQFMVHGADVVPQVVAIPQPPQANAAAAAVDTPPIVDAAPNVEPIFDGAAHLGEYELLPDGNLVEVPSKLNYDDEDPPKIRDEQAQSQAILIISSDEDDSEVKPHDVLLGVPELDLKVPEFSSDEDPPKPKLMQPRAEANVISSSSSSNEQNDQAAAGPSGLKAMNLGDLSVDCITLDDTPVNQKRIMNKAFHTPPGDSGLTPTCKRRLALAVPKPNETVSSEVQYLRVLLLQNTEVMENVARVLRSLNVD